MRLFLVWVFLAPSLFLSAKPKNPARENGYRVIREFTAVKKQEFECSTYSIGGGFLDCMINDLDLDLAFRRESSVEEARELYVNIFVDFVDFVSKDQQAQPFLHHCPPASREISCSLRFFLPSEKLQRPPLGMVASVGVGRNRILFFSTHDGNLDHPLQDLHEESLFEAIEIVRKAGKLHEYPWLDEWLVQEKRLLEEELLKKKLPPSS